MNLYESIDLIEVLWKRDTIAFVTVAVSEEREWDPDAANIHSNKRNKVSGDW